MPVLGEPIDAINGTIYTAFGEYREAGLSFVSVVPLAGDANGSTYATVTDNRLRNDGTYEYEYDPEGNRLARYVDVNANQQLDSGDTDITQYTWDHRNRLISVTDRATFGGAASQTIDYVYDAFDRMISKTVDPDGAGSQPVETKYFLYDGRRAVLTLDESANVLRRSLWTDAVDSYRYVQNAATMAIDPTGLWLEWIVSPIRSYREFRRGLRLDNGLTEYHSNRAQKEMALNPGSNAGLKSLDCA